MSLADAPPPLLGAFLRRFEQQLVVNGEDHPRAAAGHGRQRGVDVDHRALQDVGGGALDREVDGDALGFAAHLPVAAVQVGHQPAPPEHRLDDAGLARLVEQVVDELRAPREAGEVGVDERLRLLRARRRCPWPA